MKRIFNRAPFFKKYGIRILFVSVILLSFYMYRNYDYLNIRFHFPAKKYQTVSVHEKGEIKFVSGSHLKIENKYKNYENISRNNSFITIQGKIDGKIDPVLAPLFNSSKYLTEIDVNDIESACSQKFNPLYPTALRRLIFFMPDHPLFNDQRWEINTCQSKFRCSYALSTINKKWVVDMLCSGIILNSEVAMIGNLMINDKLNGFDFVFLEATASTPELVSNWTFTDSVSK